MAETKYTNEDILTVLKMARAKLKQPKGWVAGTWVRKVPGEQMYAHCATGAVGAAVREQFGGSTSLRRRAVKKLQEALPKTWRREWGGEPSVESYNDEQHDPSKVIELFDRGIEAVEKELGIDSH